MKTHYKLSILLFAMGISVVSRAQILEYINANNVNAGFGIGGNPFSLLVDTLYISSPANSNNKFALLEVPKDTNRIPVYTVALWISGADAGNNLHLAANNYNRGRDFFDGPIDINYSAQYDTFYQRVFKVTKAQIDYFRTLPIPVPASQIDTNIRKWCAKGNPFAASDYGVNIASHLAPFEDVNGDEIYNPADGDYPLISGDEAIFFVFNDARFLHTQTNGMSLGMEIRGLAEVFVDNSSNAPYGKRAVNNTVFISYEIENKSTKNYHDFILSVFEDPDLGCYNDDRVGCDTNRNLMFVYNGIAHDLGCNGEHGYDPYKATHGVKMLNRNLGAFVYFTNAQLISDPSTAQQYRNYQMGHWRDGTPFTEGGDGYGGTIPTKFIFSGNPNDTTSWNEVSAGLPMGDRRMTGSTVPENFNAGEVKCFDFAFITSFDSTSTIYDIVDTLKRDADIVQAFYDNLLVDCNRQLTGINKVNDEMKLSLFPNPANQTITITNIAPHTPITISNLLGEVLIKDVSEGTVKTIDISRLPAGMYFLNKKKFVKE